MPCSSPMPIPLAVLDCQSRIAHDAAARISSSARIRVRSRRKLIVLPLSVTEPRPSCTAVPKSVPMRSVLVSVMIPDPGLRVFQTLLIPSLGNQVEVLVGSVHHVDAPRVARVGVKHRAALVFVEDADALTVHHAGVRSCIVEERRSTLDFLGGKGGLIVKVEIALERRDPLEAPSHPLFEQLDLGKRGSRNGHKGHVAVIEVNTDAIKPAAPEEQGKPPFAHSGGDMKG